MTAHPALTALVLLSLVLGVAACLLASFAFLDVRKLRRLPNRRPASELRADDERQLNLGAPRATGERRSADLGPSARHRASPDLGRARRRDVDDPQWQTQQQPAVDDDPGYPPRPQPRPVDEPQTVEHAPPTADMRRLPPPGSITR